MSRLLPILVAGAVLSGCRDDTERVAFDAEALVVSARREAAANRWPQAVRLFERAIESVRGRKALSSRERDWKGELAELRRRVADRGELDRRFETFRKGGALLDGQRLLEESAGWPVAWWEELQALIGQRKTEAGSRMPSFEEQRRTLLATRDKDWSGQRTSWEAYAAEARVGEEDRRKAREELPRVQARAKEDLRSVILRADREGAAERRRRLEAERPRFKGMACASDLEAALLRGSASGP